MLAKKRRLQAASPHPLQVKPDGNALVEVENVAQHRRKRMGLFGTVNDTILMMILQELSRDDLLNVGHTCKSMFAYCWFDELWKTAVKETGGQWQGSWRCTALGINLSQEAKIDCQGVYSDFLHRPYELSQICYDDYIEPKENIPRVSEDEALERYEKELYKTPFVMKLRKPIAEWTLDSLVAEFGDEIFRQEYMDWPLKVYRDYCLQNNDETPLYLFDCKSKAHKHLEYSVPLEQIWRQQDLFSLFGDERPDHQWLIIGPRRSGSTFHKDPNATSAWNSVISGHKYWIMFPGQSPPPGVWTSSDQSEVTAPASLAEWFASGLYKEARQRPEFKDAVTGPGEVMYVPSGWWHAVVNLDDCIAMTGNFVVAPFLSQVLSFLKTKEDQISGFENPTKIYEKFVTKLGSEYPELVEKHQPKQSWNEIAKTTETFTFGFS